MRESKLKIEVTRATILTYLETNKRKGP